MVFLRKHRLEIVLLVLITGVFFASRLYNIVSLPIFTDEAIYIRWSQIAKQDANWRFISLTDGKQPMFVWISMIFMHFVKDPLLAGRLVSVFAGFFTMIGLFFLGREIFKSRFIGIASAVLYTIYPFALVYDRMALYDSLVGTFAVWGLYFIILLARRVRLDVALILGMVLGGGVLTKTTGFLSIYLLPFSLLLFDWQKTQRAKRLLKLFGLGIAAVVLTYGFYSILRLSPFFHIITDKNALFVYPLKEWLEHPYRFLYGNLRGEWDWLWRYLTFSGILLLALSLFPDRKFQKEKIFLFLWFLTPFILLALFGRVLYPRFIFFMTLPLLALISFSLLRLKELLKNKILLVGCILFFSIVPLYSDYLIIADFSHASIPVSDLRQYNNDWPAGGGVRESIQFFKEQAKKGKIYIGTQGTFGLLPYALEIYLLGDPNITIEGLWPIEATIPQKVKEKSQKMPTYFIFYQPCNYCKFVGTAPVTWNSLNIIYQYKKAYGVRYYSLYQVLP